MVESMKIPSMSNIEATIICIDNSDYNRNEDIVPNRFLSQVSAMSLRRSHELPAELSSLKIDCVNVLCCNKTSVHYKNNIGILMMAGDKVKVKVSLTNDIGQLLSCIHDIKLDGTCDVVRSLLIAQLALKHRVDKNLDQRIILFVGSPFEVNEKQLIHTGKQLKKNNISVDIVSYGNVNSNRDKLVKLLDCVNNSNNCRLIECPENEINLSKFVLNSFLNNSDFGIGNMQDDEQLINAMQLSMEDNHQGNDGKGSSSGIGNTNTSGGTNDLPTIEEIENMKDIDNELKEALILSLKEYTEKNKSDAEAAVSAAAAVALEGSADANTGTVGVTSSSAGGLQFHRKKEENLTLVNESYKNNFDNDVDETKVEEDKEKKENESYEKVFKLDKDENIEETAKCTINEHIYNKEEDTETNTNSKTTTNTNTNTNITTKSKNDAVVSGEEAGDNNPSAIQDTNYISTILGKISPTVNVFTSTAAEGQPSDKPDGEEDDPEESKNGLGKNGKG
ncbi:26S proteasome regulatory subunit RPN10, putative (RPN10) [Plasmodium ovale curtisi]|uniref:26S proteasome regulatory subunit RPN10, putative (RPN10) n=1 Tax=Plasmodium ovale curtisi TaxID=864141 RepID=A0A1A8VJ02_PLAOA|nr:26S proteasome regulatory subunit RPN10, putative (RPN10) [Plasmodium ovale curtisi]